MVSIWCWRCPCSSPDHSGHYLVDDDGHYDKDGDARSVKCRTKSIRGIMLCHNNNKK